jgi:hypothetical protein
MLDPYPYPKPTIAASEDDERMSRYYGDRNRTRVHALLTLS